MYVTTQMQKMIVPLDLAGFVGTLEQCPAVRVAFVICLAVAVEDMLWQQAGSLFTVLVDKQMVMVGHQAVGDEYEVKFLGVSLDLAQDKGVIVLFAEDGFAMSAAVVDVVETAGDEFRSFMHKVPPALRCEALPKCLAPLSMILRPRRSSSQRANPSRVNWLKS
jgi:hypothetical protein